MVSSHSKFYPNMIMLLFVVIIFGSCTHYPPGVQETLSLSGANRGELKKVLHHYQKEPKDSLKYEAACFLIDNMKWHQSTEQAIFPDSSIYKWHARIDNLYKFIMDESLETMIFSSQEMERNAYFSMATRQLIHLTSVDTPYVKKGEFPDPKHISATFLITHIENAFQVWEQSPYASHLTFDQFKEALLPYRAIAGYSFYENGKRLNEMFKRWFDRLFIPDLEKIIIRYNHYTNFVRSALDISNHTQHVGIYDLFLGNKGDCIYVANNACNVFRSCGIPFAVDYNISHTKRSGRHFHVKLIDGTKKQVLFNDSPIFDTDSISFMATSPSFFRSTFGAQRDSPYMLKAKGESLPSYFDTPCIKEVTREYYPTVRLSLPFDKNITNQVAYLYTFNNSEGIIPATWGKIDKRQGQAIFENATYYTIYFPSYLQADTVVAFAAPFYIAPVDSVPGSCRVVKIAPSRSPEKGTITLLRKYPKKNNLKQAAKEMIGGRFEGANKEDFSDATLLYTIDKTPILNLQEYTPVVSRSFRHYRYIPPIKDAPSNISILDFLTDEYTSNDLQESATSLPIQSNEDVLKQAERDKYIKLYPDTVNYPDQRGHPSFNTSMQKSIPTICPMSLKRPMKVKKIRMAPRNAENHIVVGHRYQLLYWDNGWKNAGVNVAHYNFLEFKNVPQNSLYWLRNLSEGKEELPFIYHNGKQLFIYHDTIVPSKPIQSQQL